MANKIDSLFLKLKREKRTALIGYITAGHPTKPSLKTLVPLLEKAGVDILEIGIPFSDPIADGPTIQQSSQIALENGATLPWIFQTVRALKSRVEIPLVFMTYCNPIYAMGVRRFFGVAREAGVSGVIIPDLIIEEAEEFTREAKRSGVHLIFLVAPTTPVSRIREIADATRGFLYAVSVTGVTGSRQSLPIDAGSFLEKVRQLSKRPVAVGFGLSTPKQVREMARYADGVIVGSALIRKVEKSKNTAFKGAGKFIRSLRAALDR